MANPKVEAHGTVVLQGLKKALKIMDDIKNTYTSLSEHHSEKLQVDPGNFQLLGDCLTVLITTRLRTEFTPDIQAAWQKFLSVVVSALSRQYH
uniref:Hemoglobin beta embryonic-3 n=1 Tax=Cyprinus carpio carpio TaxID=630221 RepID=A0A8C1F835_CYPCA